MQLKRSCKQPPCRVPSQPVHLETLGRCIPSQDLSSHAHSPDHYISIGPY